jgi:glutamate-1-semialdehyde 2,1-aminomutase/spore coat polysaccharide biosynthesis protein SpsF
MQAAREKIAAAGLANVVKLVGVPPWAILSYADHQKASKEAIKTLFLREMIAAGVLINASHNICFAHTPSDIARVLAAYDHALAVLRDALEQGDIDRRLGNQVIKPIFSVRAAS